MDAVLFMKMLAVCNIESLCAPPLSFGVFSGAFCRCAACEFAACAVCDMLLQTPMQTNITQNLYISHGAVHGNTSLLPQPLLS